LIRARKDRFCHITLVQYATGAGSYSPTLTGQPANDLITAWRNSARDAPLMHCNKN
jgi:hypothetical protein